ncbi:MAG: hypothetical protein AABO41_18045 [Acidobacteriota bacterium]
MKKVVAFPVLLAILAVSAGALASDDKDKLSGAEIINKHIAAVGGKKALSKFQSRVAIGTARKDNDNAIPVAIMSEPNRLSAIYQFEGFNWYLLYDGSKPSVRPVLTRAAAPIMHKYEEMLSTGTLFNDISLYNVLNQVEPDQFKFEAKGFKKVKSRQAYAVDMKPSKGQTLRLYFDAEDFMWLRTDYGTVQITREMGPITGNKDQETIFDFYVETSDFKEVDGVKLPFRFEIVATAPILKQKSVGTIVATINEYRHNVAIDPKMFQ